MANPWGGKLHRVIKDNYGPCFECGGWLLVGEYVHVRFGGLVVVHCRCACEKSYTTEEFTAMELTKRASPTGRLHHNRPEMQRV